MWNVVGEKRRGERGAKRGKERPKLSHTQRHKRHRARRLSSADNTPRILACTRLHGPVVGRHPLPRTPQVVSTTSSLRLFARFDMSSIERTSRAPALAPAPSFTRASARRPSHAFLSSSLAPLFPLPRRDKQVRPPLRGARTPRTAPSTSPPSLTPTSAAGPRSSRPRTTSPLRW